MEKKGVYFARKFILAVGVFFLLLILPAVNAEAKEVSLVKGDAIRYMGYSTHYYYVDGKKLTFSVKQTKLLNAKMIRKQLDELSDQNSYDFFDKNIGKEVVKEFLLNPNAMYLEAEEIYKKYQK